MLEENFWRQHSKILGQTLRKHLESISEVTKCRKKNHEKKSICFHLLLSWTKSKENFDTSWKHLEVDASNNLLLPALKDLWSRGAAQGLSGKRSCVWSGQLHLLLSFEATLSDLMVCKSP